MPKWKKPVSYPPPVFVNQPERNFQKQTADEVTEFIIGQTVVYFPVDVERTNWHPVYKEAITKVFLPPIEVKVFVDFEDQDTKNTKWGNDRKRSITVHFHKRRLTEDQNLFVREGDLIFWDDEYHEIWKLSEPEELWGQFKYKVGISAFCIKTRNPPIFTNK